MSNKKIFIFDWDNNLLNMPTKINGVFGHQFKREISISTEEYAKVRNSKGYFFDPTTSFENFKKDESFIRDVNISINESLVAPSINKFRECILHGHDFSIITARGHKPSTIKVGILQLIFKYLSPEELVTIINNIGDLVKYIDSQLIYPVTSEWFNVLFGLDVNEKTVEERKILAFKHYVDTRMSSISEIDISAKLSFGFSDDDKLNIEAIKKLIEEDLYNKYKNVKFYLFDTSNPEKTEKIRFS